MRLNRIREWKKQKTEKKNEKYERQQQILRNDKCAVIIRPSKRASEILMEIFFFSFNILTSSMVSLLFFFFLALRRKFVSINNFVFVCACVVFVFVPQLILSVANCGSDFFMLHSAFGQLRASVAPSRSQFNRCKLHHKSACSAFFCLVGFFCLCVSHSFACQSSTFE